jgi:hypothetical protein
MMIELFAYVVWATRAAPLFAARIAFYAQTIKLAPVMRKIHQGLLPLTLLAAAFAPLSMAHAGQGHGKGKDGFRPAERAPPAVMQRDGVSLDEAVSRAEQQFHARVVRTEVQDEDGRKVYVLKLLSEDGRVFTVRIDASTGRMR